MLLAVVIAGQAFAVGNQLFEAEATKHISGAASLPDRSAAGGCVVSLTRSGAGVEFTKLPTAGKLAIRYASVSVGTIIGVGGGFSSPVIAGVRTYIAGKIGDDLKMRLSDNLYIYDIKE
jgi:hypothetical protein